VACIKVRRHQLIVNCRVGGRNARLTSIRAEDRKTPVMPWSRVATLVEAAFDGASAASLNAVEVRIVPP